MGSRYPGSCVFQPFSLGITSPNPRLLGSLSLVEWSGLIFLLLQLCLEPGDKFLPLR